MDAYDSYGACQRITQYVDALSNWYVRRSRERFWASDKQRAEKLDAYWTLYECLVDDGQGGGPLCAVPGRNAVAKSGGQGIRGTGSRKCPPVRLS